MEWLVGQHDWRHGPTLPGCYALTAAPHTAPPLTSRFTPCLLVYGLSSAERCFPLSVPLWVRLRVRATCSLWRRIW
jgi:hypothetical protein